MGLTEFLLARIAEDEEAAKAAQYVTADDLTDHHESCWWIKEEHGRIYAGGWLRVVDGGAPAGDRTFANTAALPHIARHDPARVLAECEAKRRIVAEHEIDSARRVDGIDVVVDGKRQPAWVGGGCFRCHDGEGADAVTGELGYCDTLRYLAAVYADHPDCREEWKP